MDIIKSALFTARLGHDISTSATLITFTIILLTGCGGQSTVAEKEADPNIAQPSATAPANETTTNADTTINNNSNIDTNLTNAPALPAASTTGASPTSAAVNPPPNSTAAPVAGLPPGNSRPDDSTYVSIPATWYQPQANTTWQWQLQGDVNTGYNVELFDIDLFDTPPELIKSAQLTGTKVICYFSAGSYEDWRADAPDFKPADLGKALDGWPGEKWIDIRSTNVRQIMVKRLDFAQQKGCDGVEPDNVDAYTNNTGLNLTAADQLDFNRFLAKQAHERGLSIALKNNLDQVASLVDDFDFVVNEQCHEYNECDLLKPFVKAGKAVFNVEYEQKFINSVAERKKLCYKSKALGIKTLILPLDLDDSFRFSCDAIAP